MTNKSSFCYWYPKIVGKIPAPRTVIVPLSLDDTDSLYCSLDGKPIPDNLISRIKAGAAGFNYPVFMRTDEISGKHSFKETCFVTSEKEILSHVLNLVIETTMLFTVSFNAIIFREYLNLNSSFKAFNGLPIASERRYFVDEGKVLCHHPYWPEGAIEDPSRSDWRIRLAKLNEESAEEVKELSAYAEQFAKELEGAWSVDFAKLRTGKWIMIDAAEAHRSWHPSDCKIAFGE